MVPVGEKRRAKGIRGSGRVPAAVCVRALRADRPLSLEESKRGFNNVFATRYAVVNVFDLEQRFEAGAVIDDVAIIDSGLVKKPLDGIKLLAKGEVSKAFTIKTTAISEAAKAKIESAGGKSEVVE